MTNKHIILIPILVACLLHGAAMAQSVTLSNTVTADYTTLEAAVAAVVADPATPDTITLLASDTINIATSGGIVVSDSTASLTLQAAPGATPTISGRFNLQQAGSLTLTGIRFKHDAAYDPILFVQGNMGPVTVTDCTFNNAISGMAFHFQSTAPCTFTDCTINASHTPMRLQAGNVTFTRCAITGSQAFDTFSSNPIYSSPNLTFDRCVIVTDGAYWNSPGQGSPGKVKLVNCLFTFKKMPIANRTPAKAGIQVSDGGSLELVHTTMLSLNNVDTLPALYAASGSVEPGTIHFKIENCYFDLSPSNKGAIQNAMDNPGDLIIEGQVNAYHTATPYFQVVDGNVTSLPSFESAGALGVAQATYPNHFYDTTGHVIAAEKANAQAELAGKGALLAPAVTADLDGDARATGSAKPALGCDEVSPTTPPLNTAASWSLY